MVSQIVFTVDGKRKKPPACDSCKARRVLCHSQPLESGLPCPRCVEKGIQCVTTPVKRRKRVVNSKTEFKTWTPSYDSSHRNCPLPFDSQYETTSPKIHVEQDNCVIGIKTQPETQLIVASPVQSRLMLSQLSSSVINNLLDAIKFTLDERQPFVIKALKTLRLELDEVNMQLSALNEYSRAFAYAAMAFGSQITDDPYILGSDCPYTMAELNRQHSEIDSFLDLREFGKKRESMCWRLHMEALKAAKQTDVTTSVSVMNASTCKFLTWIENLHPSTEVGGALFAASYIAQVKVLIDHPDFRTPATEIVNCASLNQLALTCVTRKTPVPFSEDDEIHICGTEVPTLDALLAMMASFGQTQLRWRVFTVFRLYISQNTKIARESISKITGSLARSRPLNITRLQQLLTSLSSLKIALDFLLDQMDRWVIEFPEDDQEQFTRPVCLFLVGGYGCILLALYSELKRRQEEEFRLGFHLITDTNEPSLFMNLDFLWFYNQTRRMTIEAAVLIALRIRKPPPSCRLALVDFMSLGPWAKLLLDEEEVATSELGVDVYTCLNLLFSGMKLAGWAVVDRSGVMDQLEKRLSSEVCLTVINRMTQTWDYVNVIQ